MCELFSLPNCRTNLAEIWYVLSKFPDEHYYLYVGVVMGVVL